VVQAFGLLMRVCKLKGCTTIRKGDCPAGEVPHPASGLELDLCRFSYDDVRVMGLISRR
jgi:hypothetical protein